MTPSRKRASRHRTWPLLAVVALCSWGGPGAGAEEKHRDLIRVGIIGLDTSHAVAFTRILNDANRTDHVPGARVVAAYPGGSPDIPASADRLEGFTRTLRDELGIEIVDDIEELCRRVDAVLLESVDGRRHLRELRPVLEARKPVFIDKPLAGSFEDAREIVRLAKETGVPCFSSSSLRFFPGVARVPSDPAVGRILGVDAYSPCHLEPHHPDLYWYGVHGVEILFTLMGPGCDEVTRVHTADQDIVVGRWKDGRIGTYRGIRSGKSTFGATVFGSAEIRSTDPISGSLYQPLLVEIVRFFQTGEAPVPLDETLEMFAFMSAADLSKERGGKPVKLAELLGERAAGAEATGSAAEGAGR